MRNPGKFSAVNREFLDRVKPIMESWGLSKHPNPTSFFGHSGHGFRYDFADLNNKNDIKIAAFAILISGGQLWIRGLRLYHEFHDNRDIPIIYDNLDDVFMLMRKWSILRPINTRFEIYKKGSESNEEAASRLMDIVVCEIPKLKDCLYR